MSKDANSRAGRHVAEPISTVARTPSPLINEGNFQLLKAAQQRITEKTGISPQLSVLINLLITEDAIDRVENVVKSQLLELARKLSSETES